MEPHQQRDTVVCLACGLERRQVLHRCQIVGKGIDADGFAVQPDVLKAEGLDAFEEGEARRPAECRSDPLQAIGQVRHLDGYGSFQSRDSTGAVQDASQVCARESRQLTEGGRGRGACLAACGTGLLRHDLDGTEVKAQFDACACRDGGGRPNAEDVGHVAGDIAVEGFVVHQQLQRIAKLRRKLERFGMVNPDGDGALVHHVECGKFQGDRGIFGATEHHQLLNSLRAEQVGAIRIVRGIVGGCDVDVVALGVIGKFDGGQEDGRVLVAAALGVDQVRRDSLAHLGSPVGEEAVERVVDVGGGQAQRSENGLALLPFFAGFGVAETCDFGIADGKFEWPVDQVHQLADARFVALVLRQVSHDADVGHQLGHQLDGIPGGHVRALCPQADLDGIANAGGRLILLGGAARLPGNGHKRILALVVTGDDVDGARVALLAFEGVCGLLGQPGP